ncbi:hypothetical protein VPH35_033561 [Triticum aestivum]
MHLPAPPTAVRHRDEDSDARRDGGKGEHRRHHLMELHQLHQSRVRWRLHGVRCRRGRALAVPHPRGHLRPRHAGAPRLLQQHAGACTCKARLLRQLRHGAAGPGAERHGGQQRHQGPGEAHQARQGEDTGHTHQQRRRWGSTTAGGPPEVQPACCDELEEPWAQRCGLWAWGAGAGGAAAVTTRADGHEHLHLVPAMQGQGRRQRRVPLRQAGACRCLPTGVGRHTHAHELAPPCTFLVHAHLPIPPCMKNECREQGVHHTYIVNVYKSNIYRTE